MGFNIKTMLVVTCLLLQLTVSLDWQSMGNFTDDNITAIKLAISEVTDASVKAGSNSGEANLLSTKLNNLWDPAWNVLILRYTNTAEDAVVYGYAFNNHWIWLNNYKDTKVNYVIWKDYNCHTWVSLDSTLAIVGDMDNTVYQAFTSGIRSNSIAASDPWLMAYTGVSSV